MNREVKGMNWISVKDRLPENTDEVLVCFIGWDDLQFQSVMYLENGDWYNEHGDPCYTVTHWMPLPEPPNN